METLDLAFATRMVSLVSLKSLRTFENVFETGHCNTSQLLRLKWDNLEVEATLNLPLIG